MKKFLFVLTVVALLCNTAMSQNVWQLGGNNIGGQHSSGILGTKNSKQLLFITNNTPRFSISEYGNAVFENHVRVRGAFSIGDSSLHFQSDFVNQDPLTNSSDFIASGFFIGIPSWASGRISMVNGYFFNTFVPLYTRPFSLSIGGSHHSHKLHIEDQTGGTSPAVIGFTNNITGHGVGNGFKTGLEHNTSNAFINLMEAADLRFYTNDEFRMIIKGTTGTTQGFVGINTDAPTRMLDIDGMVRIRNLSGTPHDVLVTAENDGTLHSIAFPNDPNQVLLGDGTFGASPVLPPGGPFWELGGNSSFTFPNSNILGTMVPGIDLRIFAGNGMRMLVHANTGNIGINTGSPNHRLDVEAGDININTEDRGYRINSNFVLWHNGNTSNIYVGVGAGINSTGSANTFVGLDAGRLAQGGHNSFYGYKSGESDTHGLENSFFGCRTGQNNQSGRYNTLLGAHCGTHNISGNMNTFVGAQTGNNMDGTLNTFVGFRSTGGNSILENSTAIGALSQVDADDSMVLGSINGINGATASVNVGIGTTVPTERLHITDGTLGNSGLRLESLPNTVLPVPNPGQGVLTVDADGVVIYVEETTTGALGNECGITPSNPLTNDWEIPLNNHNFVFTGIDGGVGIGTTCNPLAKLHVINNSNTLNYTSRFITMNASTSDVYGIYSQTQGSTSQNYGINAEAIGTLAVNNYGVRGIAQGATNFNFGGLFVSRHSSITNYGIDTYAEDGMYAIGIRAAASYGSISSWAGWFEGNVMVNGDITHNGTYNPSDIKIKHNLHPVTNAKELVNLMNPVSFYFDTVNFPYPLSSAHQYGLIAQEVESFWPEIVNTTIFPAKYDSLGNMVSDSVHIKGIDFIKIIPILVQNVKEQNFIIDSLSNIIESYETRFQKIENMLMQCCNNDKNAKQPAFSQTVTVSNQKAIVLNQNQPNPFKEQTTITFQIPEYVKLAQIVFVDNLGNILNQVEITDRGYGELIVYAQDLSSGLYTYYLVADGKTIESKKMVVAK
jgi:hypothetical protein